MKAPSLKPLRVIIGFQIYKIISSPTTHRNLSKNFIRNRNLNFRVLLSINLSQNHPSTYIIQWICKTVCTYHSTCIDEFFRHSAFIPMSCSKSDILWVTGRELLLLLVSPWMVSRTIPFHSTAESCELRRSRGWGLAAGYRCNEKVVGNRGKRGWYVSTHSRMRSGPCQQIHCCVAHRPHQIFI